MDLFEYFSLVIEKDFGIVSFSGIMKRNIWADDVGRVSSRLFTHPEWRTVGAKPSSFNSTIMLPEQKFWAEQNGFSSVFWSREDASDLLMMRMVKRNNAACKYGYVEKFVPGLIDVVGDPNKENFQKIAVTNFD